MQTDRVIVITGAAGNMGSALVDRFLANGDTVVATDANSAALEQLRSDRGADAKIITAPADISSEEDVGKLADLARDRAGRVDVLVNCAGYFPFQPFEEISADDWRRVIDINLTGTFLMTRAMLPLMKDRGWGRIVSFGSGGYFAGVAGQAHYIAAKAGVVGFSRSIAREVGRYGITANVVTPGITLTKETEKTAPSRLMELARTLRALDRNEYPEDLVGTVFFLASPDSDYITAQIINVDGGMNAY